MEKRNTSKEKEKKNKAFPYKHRRRCFICNKYYGTDWDGDSGKCPNCIYGKKR